MMYPQKIEVSKPQQWGQIDLMFVMWTAVNI